MNIEAELKDILENIFKTDVMQQVFDNYIIQEKNSQEQHIELLLQQFKSVLIGQKLDDQSKILGILLKYIHGQKSARRVSFLFDFLDSFISKEILPVKVILDELQSNDLVYTKKLHWCKSYEIIRKFIHLVDYKGCRNLLQGMISKMREIPFSSWESCAIQVKCICDMIAHLIAPESCLLPGYLAVNEFVAFIIEEQTVAPPPLQGKLMKFVDRFCATAAMVTTSGRWKLLPVVDHTSYQLPITWKLETERLRFPVKRPLPYCKEMYQTQHRLIRHVLLSTSSREMLQQIIGVQNKRCPTLETELVELLFDTMNHFSSLDLSISEEMSFQKHLVWRHLSSQVIHLVIYQLVSFKHFLEKLHQKLLLKKQNGYDIYRGREYLTWCLLHCLSGSIQKFSTPDLTPLVKLVYLLYHEQEPLALPDITNPFCTINFSAICILTHLLKAQSSSSAGDDAELINIPISLHKHHEFVKHCLQTPSSTMQDYRISLACNSCITASDSSTAPVTILLESICTCLAGVLKTEPLKMEMLDSLTAHAKMSMLHQLGNKIQKLGQGRFSASLSPALIETYSRLLVYSELESLGIKALVGQILPSISEVKNWSVMNLLVEMISYRLYHVPPIYRMQLLSFFHTLAISNFEIYFMYSHQLLYSIENAALRVTMGFGNFDIKPQLMRALNDKKQFVSQTSEELNRVLVLTLAQSIHITGAETVSEPWCIDILKAAMTATPHKWPRQTLACFPPSMQEYYQHQQPEVVSKKNLKATVEEEYSKWGSLLSGEEDASVDDSEAMHYFCTEKPLLPFICLAWRVLFEGKHPAPIIYKVLKKMTSQELSAQIRSFSDFLLHELYPSGDGQQPERIQLCTQVILDMVWKYNFVPLDRLILSLALRSSEPNDVQVAFFIIQYLLIKSDDFRNQVRSFVQEVESTDYWNLNNWHSHHIAFQQKFPEMLFFEGLQRNCTGANTVEPTGTDSAYLPTYFSNITFRFLSVLDILIHRYLELSSAAKSLETLLTHLGSLYKFHDKPITYLFTTLHYYEMRLRDQYALKKKLVSSIVTAISEGRPENWALSRQFMTYLSGPSCEWVPTSSYYTFILRRLVDNALHVTCVEVLSLPVPAEEAGKSLMDVVLRTQPGVDKDEIYSWMNSTALVLTALPDVFWKPLHEEVLNVLRGDVLLTSPITSGSPYPYHILDYNKQSHPCSASYCTRLLALTHIVWHHMSIGQLSSVSQFLKDEAKPLVTKEMQLLYIFHLIGPYFSRFRHERTRCMIDVATSLYEMLLQVSEGNKEIHYMDEISDFLYNIKYMHIGTAILDKTVDVVARLQPELRRRLKFITHSASAPRLQTI